MTCTLSTFDGCRSWSDAAIRSQPSENRAHGTVSLAFHHLILFFLHDQIAVGFGELVGGRDCPEWPGNKSRVGLITRYEEVVVESRSKQLVGGELEFSTIPVWERCSLNLLEPVKLRDKHHWVYDRLHVHVHNLPKDTCQ